MILITYINSQHIIEIINAMKKNHSIFNENSNKPC